MSAGRFRRLCGLVALSLHGGVAMRDDDDDGDGSSGVQELESEACFERIARVVESGTEPLADDFKVDYRLRH